MFAHDPSRASEQSGGAIAGAVSAKTGPVFFQGRYDRSPHMGPSGSPLGWKSPLMRLAQRFFFFNSRPATPQPLQCRARKSKPVVNKGARAQRDAAEHRLIWCRGKKKVKFVGRLSLIAAQERHCGAPGSPWAAGGPD